MQTIRPVASGYTCTVSIRWSVKKNCAVNFLQQLLQILIDFDNVCIKLTRNEICTSQIKMFHFILPVYVHYHAKVESNVFSHKHWNLCIKSLTCRYKIITRSFILGWCSKCLQSVLTQETHKLIVWPTIIFWFQQPF